MPTATTLANNSPGSPELTLIRNFGYRISSSSSSNGSSSSNNNNYDRMKTYDNGGNSNGGDFKNVLGCDGKKDSHGKRIVVDLTWRRGKVGDKNHEYQRF